MSNRPRPDYESKELRRQEGEERNAAWRALSTEEKLKRLDSYPGECRRQRQKLSNTK